MVGMQKMIKKIDLDIFYFELKYSLRNEK